MDRKALLQAIESAGQLNSFFRSVEWQAAFEAYNKDTGDLDVTYDCGACFKKVLRWLQAIPKQDKNITPPPR